MDRPMDPKIWSKLPIEMLHYTLSFLSVPALCRFQTVCKDWAALMLTLSFQALCSQNGKANRFILERSTMKNSERSLYSESLGWRLFEVQENHWYWIDNSPDDNMIGSRYEQRSLSIDGGLACAYWQDTRTEDVRICVSRPLEKCSEILGASPYDKPFTVLTSDLERQRVPAVLTLVADHVSQGYTIFAMRSVLHDRRSSPDGGPCICVYKSEGRSWRQSSTNLAPQSLPWPVLVRCTAFFQGLLYVLISDIIDSSVCERWELWSYNHVKDSWNKVESEYDRSLYREPQLVVCGDRLFFAAWSTVHLHELVQPSVVKTFGVMEITPGQEKRSRMVFQCAQYHMEEVFETKFHTQPRITDPYNCFAGSLELTVFGMDNAIGLSARKSGLSVKVDLVSGDWSWWRFAGPMPSSEDLWFGPRPVNLILHPRYASRMFSQFTRRQVKPRVEIYLSDSDTDEE